MSTPSARYRDGIKRGELQSDPDQLIALKALDRLHSELTGAGEPLRGWRRKLPNWISPRADTLRGVYLWGSVGRGKTFLMDLFFECLPFEDKRRQHFHRFMASIHERLKPITDRPNPLDLIADQLADETRIICFDEFAVTDIADAMLLGNLFSALFERGVALAATSNIEPGDLYKDGLQRQRFLPAIKLIEKHTEVLRLRGEEDYRLRVLEKADVYQVPPGEQADRHLAEYFHAIAPEAGLSDGSVEILGREIAYRKCADGIAWFDFDALCDGPRSQDDYIELSRCYQTVLISDVPRFDQASENQARRFIALVDEFYDRRVKLILSAESEPADLYRGRKLLHDFERTKSRLQEMQSHDYLAAAHRS